VTARAGPVRLAFLGSGDAFGSGGRLQTCLLLSGGGDPVLVDCGASSLVAMKRAGVDPGEVGWVVLSHLHGDHFAGVPFMVLDGQFSRRTRPLVVAGPPGTAARVAAAMEVLFPGSGEVARRFALEFLELPPAVATPVGPAVVTPFPAAHASGAPSYSLRVEYGGRVVGYSGDTEWTEHLAAAAQGCDVFVAEAYFFDKRVRHHLDYATLRAHRDALECRRLVVTHMHADMLARIRECDLEAAHDGLVVEIA
jgi:ribonuclease BN (tRNA processing enzyme)